jgi:hypothetical protein
MAAGNAEHRVHQLGCQHVGQHDLLEQPADDQARGAPELDLARVPRAAELRQELARPDDRTGHQVREERQVDGEVQGLGRLDDAAVHVHHVGQRLEGEEADPDRQRDLEQRQRHRQADARQGRRHRRHEEAVVLEPAEHHQVAGDRGADQPGGGARRGRAVDRHGERLVHHGHGGQQQREPHVGIAVEHVAGGQDERLPPGGVGHQPPGNPQHGDEERREFGRGEDHPSKPRSIRCEREPGIAGPSTATTV